MNNLIPKFKDTTILDNYDYRIWHESEVIYSIKM